MHLPAVFPDPFAVEWGHDQYGTFQSFAVGNVVQRMRWIPPGRFMMGSPESEVGRYDNEMQHEVEIANGFWLGDTPVTQALWEAVMGANPSAFKGPENPVEMVSWNRCQKFLSRLNNYVEGLAARLLTEEEWEYSCRAGTTTTTWAAADVNFVTELDGIAWYTGNSLFYEPEWNQRKEKRIQQGTRPVKRKSPNPWGLYDMLGNVYEYCVDIQLNYNDKVRKIENDEEDPNLRNVRGGSWRSAPRYVRAANRGEHPIDRGENDLGFRLARSATPKP